jgi:hypothetical protein
MTFHAFKAGLAAATLAAFATAADAAVFDGTFTLDGPAFSDPGLVIETDPAQGDPRPFTFDIEVGDTWTIPLFWIWTDETTVNADDTATSLIEVLFDLVLPDAGAGVAAGGSQGQRQFFGLVQLGSVTWNNPYDILFGNGGILRVSLTDATFNSGLFGLNEGRDGAAKVSASFEYVQAPAPIPLPAAGFLLLGGMGALVALRRRKG